MTVGSLVTDIPQGSVHTQTGGNATRKRRISRRLAADAVALADFLAVFLGGLFPAMTYAIVTNAPFDQIVIVQTTLIGAFIAHLCLRYRNMYDTSRMDRFPIDPVELIVAVLCGLICVLGIGLPMAVEQISLPVWFVGWFTAATVMILFFRVMARVILSSLASEGRFNERIAVFGAGSIARRVHDYLSNPKLGIRFVGVFDDRIGEDRINPEGLDVEGRLPELIEKCRNGLIDRVIIALPQSANERLAGIVGRLEAQPVSTHLVTHIASDLLESDTASGVSSIGPIGLLDVKKRH